MVQLVSYLINGTCIYLREICLIRDDMWEVLLDCGRVDTVWKDLFHDLRLLKKIMVARDEF